MKDIKDSDPIETVTSVNPGGSPIGHEPLPLESNKPIFVSSLSKDEPIVTRKELWSYYRMH